MLIVAFFKRHILKNKASFFLRNSFYFYLLAISLPSLDTYGSQIALGFGVTLCSIILILVLTEVYKIKTNKLTSVHSKVLPIVGLNETTTNILFFNLAFVPARHYKKI